MIDLQSFCGDPEWRSEIATPWQRDGIVYASNGALLIALDVRAYPEFRDIPDNPEAPDAGLLLLRTEAEGAADFPPCPCPELPEMLPAPMDEVKTCPNCKGEGRVECYHCGHDMDCEMCEGTGKIIESDLPATVTIAINGELFDASQLRLMKDNFPGFMISVRRQLDDINRPATLVFPCGKGLLMPIRKERIYD